MVDANILIVVESALHLVPALHSWRSDITINATTLNPSIKEDLGEPAARLELEFDAALGAAELSDTRVTIVIDPHASNDEIVHSCPHAIKIVLLARRFERHQRLARRVDFQARA